MKAIALLEVQALVAAITGLDAMVKAAAQKGWIDEKKVVMEIMTGFVRAGADLILTYHAIDVAKWLNE